MQSDELRRRKKKKEEEEEEEEGGGCQGRKTHSLSAGCEPERKRKRKSCLFV